MSFSAKEKSRYNSNPAKLFLFSGADPSLESLMRSAAIGPGVGEFALGTTRVTTVYTPSGSEDPIPVSATQPKNYFSGSDVSDFTQSLNDLIATAPGITNVTIMVAWHGTDLRAGECRIRPRAEPFGGDTIPYAWQVGNLTRATAQTVSLYLGQAASGGAPSDRSIYEAIRAVRSRGLRCTIYPLILMDIGINNTQPSPYGPNAFQPAYPWRGLISCSPAPGVTGTADGSAAATSQIDDFFGASSPVAFSWNAGEQRVQWGAAVADVWNYRKFILHLATIAAAGDATDFLIGSQLVGLTRVRDETGAYPAVERLRALATACRSLLGTSVRISYAADWTEYHSHRIGNSVTFNMDRLWAFSEIDFVGIDNFAPSADWRNGTTHLDWKAGFTSTYDISYLDANIEGGEYFDWVYPNRDARDAQDRREITDSAYGEPWVLRQKGLRGWWANRHFNRVNGVRQASPTAWLDRSKPVVFTMIGCSAVDKGANQPAAVFDPKSGSSERPFYSNGRPDAAVQRAHLEATLRHWAKGNPVGFIETASSTVAGWDARPFPVFPDHAELWRDAELWQTGRWLTGRLSAGRSFESGTFGTFAFTDAETPITRNGIVYEPWPIKHSDITSSGTLDNSELTLTMASSSAAEASAQVQEFIEEFVGFPPSQVINLTIFQGQMDDVPTLVDYPAIWLGRVNAPQWDDNEIHISCLPVSSSIQRPGLRRNYQIGCPHVLYGNQCRASKRGATVWRTVAGVSRNIVTFDDDLPANYTTFRSGMLEWRGPNGQREVRTIITASPRSVTLRGTMKNLEDGITVAVIRGCNHTIENCRTVFNNVLNYGGQPMIPFDNPLSSKNQFY